MNISLMTVGGGSVTSHKALLLQSVRTDNNYDLGPVHANVVHDLPLNIDVIIGMNVISKHGLLVDDSAETVKLGIVSNVIRSDVQIDDPDFYAVFDVKTNQWIVEWRWKKETSSTYTHISSISMSSARPKKPYNIVNDTDADECYAEIQDWIKEGILVEHNSTQHGMIMQYLPIIAVRQEKGGKSKVRPVLDYRKLNDCIESHPAGSIPTCIDQIRKWRQWGKQCTMLDLRRAYLQVHVHVNLWTYQAVHWMGKDYLLTRLGFGLTSAPKIMTQIVQTVLKKDLMCKAGVDAYIDDLYVNEAVVSAEKVMQHLKQWGLVTKEPERIGSGESVRVLGMRVDPSFRWSREGSLVSPDAYKVGDVMTRRSVHKLIGEWIGHYPVASWLRVAAAFVQRCTAEDGSQWDDEVSERVQKIITEMSIRLTQSDPVKGDWLVSSDSPLKLWVDASSLAIGVVIEIEGRIVEDASWLRQKRESMHINVAELDAVIRGLNTALRWGDREIEVMTDSTSVYRWLAAIINKTSNVKTRSLYELLIRRRLDIIEEVIQERRLKISVKWVASASNLADTLTRVPQKWLKDPQPHHVINECRPTGITAATVSAKDVRSIHEISHFGVDKTFALAKEKYGVFPRQIVEEIISDCDQCSRIDPAPRYRYNAGELASHRIWQRLAVDVTHINHAAFLSIIDTRSRYTVWYRLRDETSAEVVDKMEQLFSEFGPPEVVISDNGSVFRSRPFLNLLRRWCVEQTLTCAYRPQGNGIIERMHRTVKRAVERSGRSVAETVFWINNTRSTGARLTPFEWVFSAKARKPGISQQRVEIRRPKLEKPEELTRSGEDNPYNVGDQVYLRRPGGRCNEPWSGPEVVTDIVSDVGVVLNDDGVTRHISHIRRVPMPRSSYSDETAVRDTFSLSDSEDEAEHSTADQVQMGLRRSTRVRKPPVWHDDYALG